MTYTKEKQLIEFGKTVDKYESGRLDTGEFINEIEDIIRETWDKATTEETRRRVILGK